MNYRKKYLMKVVLALMIAMITLLSPLESEAATFYYVAHRGNMTQAPEESYVALKLAVKNGYKYLEVDTWETNSGMFLVFHDANLKRLCGVDISISSLKRSNFRNYPYLKKFRGTKYRIISLDTALKFCKQKNIGIYIHVKNLNNGSTSANKLIKKVKSMNMGKKVTFITSKCAILRKLRTAQKEAGFSGLHYGFVSPYLASASASRCYRAAAKYRCSWIIFPYNTKTDLDKVLVSKDYVLKCKKAGIYISYYGITKSKEVKILKSIGCRGAICNARPN